MTVFRLPVPVATTGGEPSGVNRIYRLYREEGLNVRKPCGTIYNNRRPHSALAYQTRAAYAAYIPATFDQLRRLNVAHTARKA